MTGEMGTFLPTWLAEAGGALLVLYALGALVVGVVLHAFLFWVSAHLSQVEEATFGRAVKAAILLGVCWVVLGGTLALVGWGGTTTGRAGLSWWWALLAWAILSALALAPLVVLKWCFETTLGRALATYFCSVGMVLVLGSVVFPAAGLLLHVCRAGASAVAAGP